ncbi:MAG: helix-turn-helix domain-containing protein [Oscillospiraceae bacterium]
MIDLIGIGKRIKAARTEHKLTREKLAELVNVSPHYIYEIERGMKAMSLETLASISASLELSADYILFGMYHNPDDSVFAMLEELSEEKRLRAEKAFAALLPFLK